MAVETGSNKVKATKLAPGLYRVGAFFVHKLISRMLSHNVVKATKRSITWVITEARVLDEEAREILDVNYWRRPLGRKIGEYDTLEDATGAVARAYEVMSNVGR